jgi:hypothetical protein
MATATSIPHAPTPPIVRLRNRCDVRGGVTAIFLDRKDGTSVETLVDTEDLPKIAALDVKWWLCDGKYAAANLPAPSTQSVYLHRVVMGAEAGNSFIDHIHGCTLDNRKSELRPVSNSQNMLNVPGARKNSKSGVRGVVWHGRARKWQAQVTVNGKVKYLGLHTEIAAAESTVISYLGERGLVPCQQR